jgi:hypothetical protein
MHIKMNEDVVSKIVQADLLGKTKVDMKSLYIEQSALNVDLDKPIYRIFQIDYFKNDIANEILTHVKASPSTWGDTLENPLLNHEYLDETTGGKLTLNGVVEDFYALSWTIDEIENIENWNEFSHGNPSIRVKTTPRKLLEHLMHIEDEYFMLHHYIGKVEYHAQQKIKEWRANSHYTSHLDTLGQGAALSLMALSTKFSDEKEVRLLYSYLPQHDTQWVNSNVKIIGNNCQHPFNWKCIIDEVVIGPHVPSGGRQDMSTFLSSFNIVCIIKNSMFRQAND